jgi:Domain of unknown function (DUF4328)
MDPHYRVPIAKLDRDEESSFRDLGRFTSTLQWMLRAGALLAAVNLMSSWMQLELLSHSFTAEEGAANDQREAFVGGVAFLLLIATFIVFGRWIVLAHRNLTGLGARYVEFTPGWAVGWFFIPVASLWKPYQAMRMLWRYSCSVYRPEIQQTPGVLPIWWTLWIISLCLGNMLLRMTLRATSLEELDLLTRLNIANSVVDLAQYTVAVILVGRIWQAQLAQLENPDVAPTGFADAGPQTG